MRSHFSPLIAFRETLRLLVPSYLTSSLIHLVRLINSRLVNKQLVNVRLLPILKRHLALSALLLGWHDLEIAVVQRALRLWLLRAWTALLGNLTPTTAGLVLGRARSVALVDDALVSQLTAPQELLGEMTAVNVVSSRMDRFGDELLLRREAKQRGDKFLGYLS